MGRRQHLLSAVLGAAAIVGAAAVASSARPMLVIRLSGGVACLMDWFTPYSFTDSLVGGSESTSLDSSCEKAQGTAYSQATLQGEADDHRLQIRWATHTRGGRKDEKDESRHTLLAFQGSVDLSSALESDMAYAILRPTLDAQESGSEIKFEAQIPAAREAVIGDKLLKGVLLEAGGAPFAFKIVQVHTHTGDIGDQISPLRVLDIQFRILSPSECKAPSHASTVRSTVDYGDYLQSMMCLDLDLDGPTRGIDLYPALLVLESRMSQPGDRVGGRVARGIYGKLLHSARVDRARRLMEEAAVLRIGRGSNNLLEVMESREAVREAEILEGEAEFLAN